MNRRYFTVPVGIVFGLALLFLLAVNGALFFLTTERAKNMVSGYASNYVEGTVSVGTVDYTFWSSFPRVGLTLGDVRFEIPFINNMVADTVFCLDRLDLELNWAQSVLRREWFVSKLDVGTISVFVHLFTDSTSNWNVLKTDTFSKNGDSEPFSFPKIVLKQASVTSLHFRYLNDLSQTEVEVDSFRFSLRSCIYRDSVSAVFKASAPRVFCREASVHLDSVPFALSGEVVVSDHFEKLDIKSLLAEVKNTSLNVLGQVQIADSAALRIDLAYFLSLSDLADFTHFDVHPYGAGLKRVNVAGNLQVGGDVRGVYDYKGRVYPAVSASCDLRNASLAFEGKRNKIDSLDFSAGFYWNMRQKDSSFVHVNRLSLHSGRSFVDLSGSVDSLFDRNTVRLHMAFCLDIPYLMSVVPQTFFSKADGLLWSTCEAEFDWDDIRNKRFNRLYSKAELHVSHLRLKSDSLDLDFFADSLNWYLGTNSMVLKKSKRKAFFVSRLAFDSLDIRYQDLVRKCHLSRFIFNCNADNLKNGVPNLRASLTLNGMDGVFDTLLIYSKKARTSFSIKPDKVDSLIPSAKLRLMVDSLLVGMPQFGFRFDSTQFEMQSMPRVRYRFRSSRRKTAEENLRDSLGWIHARDVRQAMTLDSLFNLCGQTMKSADPSTEVMRKFRFSGQTAMKALRCRSAYFQLPVVARRMDMTFTDDTLRLKKFRLRVGHSRLKLNGEVRNMRRALLRHKTFEANFTLQSKDLDLNEIFAAYSEGKKLHDSFRIGDGLLIGDGEFLRMEDVETEQQTEASADERVGLFVVPPKLDLKFNADIDTIRFSDLRLGDFKGDVSLKDEILRIRNLSTSTNLGRFSMNVMYQCKTMEEALAGVDLKTEQIDVDHLIAEIPVLDSIVPMLRSFDGKLDCSLTAVAKLDSSMNVNLPSLSAAAFLHGEDMVLLDGETFSEIAKSLMFKNKQRNMIDSISVELTIKNNQMEVLPFMLEMDRYRAAIGGVHNFDMSFNYHISVLKSPIPFKLGLNVYGNPDKFKFKLGSPKYKDEKSITRTGSLQGLQLNVREQFQQSLQKVIMEASEIKK